MSDSYPTGKNPVKALLRRLDDNIGQVVTPDDALTLDVTVPLSLSSHYWLEVLAAYYGLKKADLAVQLLEVALGQAADHTHTGDQLECSEYVQRQEMLDYCRRWIQAMRTNWQSQATINAPDQRPAASD